MRNVRGGQCSESEPVIASGKGQYARFSRPQHRGFERGFNRFETGVAQDYLAGAGAPALEGQFAELFAKSDFSFRRMNVAHRVNQLCRLLGDGGSDRRIRMSETRDAEGRSQVEKPVAVGVPDIDSL